METPRIAFAPRDFLLAVLSSLIMARSIWSWSQASWPNNRSAILSLTLSTAFWTPFPRYCLGFLSRSSNASREPVDAPDGTAARPMAPLPRRQSTSMVGLPRESRISRAKSSAILNIAPISLSRAETRDVWFHRTDRSDLARPHLLRSNSWLSRYHRRSLVHARDQLRETQRGTAYRGPAAMGRPAAFQSLHPPFSANTFFTLCATSSVTARPLDCSALQAQ